MKEALKEARKAYKKDEVPVGAVIVKDGEIIARAHNVKEQKKDTTKHAEIIAIQKASKKLESWRLENCTMYVTLEPCAMCTGAMIQARLKKVVIGTMDEKTGACGSVLNLLEDYKFNHVVEIEKGVMETECKKILQQFFKELREKTGAGMMDCKKVLTETDGDLEKAAELLREKGITKAAKKSGRVAAEGMVEAYISEDEKVGAIVEVNSETDFVAKNEEFRTFVMDVAKQIVKNNPESVEALLAEPAMFEEGKTVNEALIGKIATIGENISIRRFARFETTDGLIEKYIHGDGKIAVLVNMTSGTKELAKDVCMQIAAARPEFIDRDQVPAERVEKEKEILKIQTMNEGKPEAIAEKIVLGRINKFYQEICLVDQEFVKDPSKKVSDILKDSKVLEFARFETGEGIEKKEENFAEEVMKQLK